MDEKINFAPINPTPTDPIKTDTPPASDIKPPDNLNHMLNPDPTPSSKVDIESAFNQNSSSPIAPFPETKKSNKAILVLGAILLMIVAAAASGFAVYYYFSTQIQPMQKDKALLQSQVGNLKSQIDVLQKDKTNLESEVTRLEDAAKTQVAPETQPATSDQAGAGAVAPGQAAPAPAAPTTPPPTLGTGGVPTP